jgi:hypothetical protein
MYQQCLYDDTRLALMRLLDQSDPVVVQTVNDSLYDCGEVSVLALEVRVATGLQCWPKLALCFDERGCDLLHCLSFLRWVSNQTCAM